jgi:hypothetical protein
MRRRVRLGATIGKRPRLQWLVRLIPLSLPVLVAACDCTDLGTIAVHLTLAEAGTGRPLDFANTDVVLVESGRVEDSLHFGPTDSQSRASLCCGGGTYTVRVRKVGFAPCTVDGLEAESDHCGHTKGVVARAYLRRL